MSKVLYPHLKVGRVIIRNLPYDITANEIKELGNTAGQVVDMTFPTSADGKSKGFAFVQYSNKLNALKAIKKLNNTKIKGRAIAMDLALPSGMYKTQKEKVKEEEKVKKEEKKEEKEEKKEEASKDEEDTNIEPEKVEPAVPAKKRVEFDSDRTLFIRNISYDATKEELRELLAKFGKIVYLAICESKLTGSSKGTGFVMFQKKESAEKVLAIDNSSEEEKKQLELKGKLIYLMKAVSKDKVGALDSRSKENKQKRRREEKKQKKDEIRKKKKLAAKQQK
jgi:RNA recognition motif-containing protein